MLLDASGNTTIPGNLTVHGTIVNTNLQNELNNRSLTNHTHTIAQVTNLQTELDERETVSNVNLIRTNIQNISSTGPNSTSVIGDFRVTQIPSPNNTNIMIDTTIANSWQTIRWNFNNNPIFRLLGWYPGNVQSRAFHIDAIDGIPISVRHCNAAFTAVHRTLMLLDASGNTTIPGNLTVHGTIVNTTLQNELNNRSLTSHTHTTLGNVTFNADGIRLSRASGQNVISISTNDNAETPFVGTYLQHGANSIARVGFIGPNSATRPLEISTGWGNNIGIVARQYSGNNQWSTIRNELTPLNAAGHTIIPNNLTVNGKIINTNLQNELNNKANVNHTHPDQPTLHRFTDTVLQHASQYRSIQNVTITQNVIISTRQIQISVIPIANTPISYADFEYEITCGALFNPFRMIVRLVAFVINNVSHIALLEAEYFDEINEILLDGVMNHSGQLMLNFTIPPALAFSRSITCRASGFGTHNPSFNLTPGGSIINYQRYSTAEGWLFQAIVRQATRNSMNNIVDLLYPVGSFYINTTNSTNPATLFGRGTWVRHSGLLWSTTANDGNTTFPTNASLANGGNLPGYGWRRTA
jgi:hypothetical protein